MTEIHPTAIVEEGARLGNDVSIGPYSCVGAEVELGDGVTVMAHVVIGGRTTVGPNCQFFPFASIGLRPQDLKYAGEPSELIIGANNIVREYVTMNPGTAGGNMVTRVGTSRSATTPSSAACPRCTSSRVSASTPWWAA